MLLTDFEFHPNPNPSILRCISLFSPFTKKSLTYDNIMVKPSHL